MLKNILYSTILTSSFLFANNNENINYELKLINSVIPNTKISKYEQSEIQGFYKIYIENGNLFYVNPFNKLILFGEIWTNNGFSLTQNDREKWQEEISNKLLFDLNSNNKINEIKKVAKHIKFNKGSKKYEFILFTDPECPYCKITEEYFEDNKDLDLFVVFTPLDFHKNAKDWSLKALSSKDLKNAMKDIKEGKIPTVKITDEALKNLEEMQNLAKKLNVDGTPKILVIDKNENKVIDSINGANINAINKYQMENN